MHEYKPQAWRAGDAPGPDRGRPEGSGDAALSGRSGPCDSHCALLDDPALLAHEPGQALPDDWTERLFAHMEALYGHQFHAQWREIDPRRMRAHWSAQLGLLTAAQLQRGVGRLAASPAAPNLPQFVRLCKPAIDPHAAYFEAVAGVMARERGELGEWSDPCIYWAAAAIGAFDLKTLPYAQLKRRWEQALAAEQAQPHGGPIPLPAQAPAPDRCAPQRSPSAARKVVAELHASIAQARQDAPDHKRWARRIQSRIAEGDESVTELQASVAKQALG